MPKRATPDAAGKRVALMARTTIDLRKALEDAAGESGRSLAQEVELRLENSFRDKALHEALLGGKRSAAALQIIAAIFKMSKTPEGKNWEEDAGVANVVGIAINRLITQISGECFVASGLLKAHPELERSITYAGQLIANHAILSYKAEFDAEVMVGREGGIAPPEAIERFVVNREKV